jgi:hypothetical protein
MARLAIGSWKRFEFSLTLGLAWSQHRQNNHAIKALKTAVASSPIPAATPAAAVSQIPAAVVNPLIWFSACSFRIAPAPRKPADDGRPLGDNECKMIGVGGCNGRIRAML